MYSKYKSILLTLLLIPCAGFAMVTGDYFQQGLTVINRSGQGILITDSSETELQNRSLDFGYKIIWKYSSDQFTKAQGQTFTHTVNINSATDYSLICTVQSNLFISQTSTLLSKPSSTNETRCQTSTYQQFGNNGAILGFQIIVL